MLVKAQSMIKIYTKQFNTVNTNNIRAKYSTRRNLTPKIRPLKHQLSAFC